MRMFSGRRPTSLLLIGLLGMLGPRPSHWLAASAAEPSPHVPSTLLESAVASEARQLIEAAGVRQGLCVLLGCASAGRAELAAELAAQSGFLVHMLAPDAEAAARALKAIESRGQVGRATAECAPLNPLPYMTELIRVLAVDDVEALSKHGLRQEELLRVLAPEGILLTRQLGKWIQTVKPRSAEMDQWTHPNHGADGNQYSTDNALQLPLSLRWQDGIPVNLSGFGAQRAWVIAGGRIFTVGINELENAFCKPVLEKGEPHWPQYLTARDAACGLPLWKLKLSSMDNGCAPNWINAAPLAADAARVYVGAREGLIIVDAATGRILAHCPTRFPVERLLLSEGTLVVASWENKQKLPPAWILTPKSAADACSGTVEAFEAASGKPLWRVEALAFRILAADGVVYAQTIVADPAVGAEIVALELNSGQERWRVTRPALGCEAGWEMSTCGPGFVTVSKQKENAVAVLSATDGSIRFQKPRASNWVPLIDGALWIGGKKFDPLTGAESGRAGLGGGNHCQAAALTPRFSINNYGLFGRDKAQPSEKLPGIRFACIEGLVPAYGSLYTAQNACACQPAALYGFLCIGRGEPPPATEFEAPRPLEKGPAFSAPAPSRLSPDDWPTLRGNPLRSAATAAKLPDALKELWRVQALKPDEDVLANAWRSLLLPCISPPVVQDGRAFTALSDCGQLKAYDAARGTPLWSATLPSRLSGPPTLYRGLCLLGCHDGWVYALRASDGQLSWRSRIAPQEKRMVAFGRVESPWPVPGSVLVYDDTLYASAGKSSEAACAIALLALDPTSGSRRWARSIAAGAHRLNDVLTARDGKLMWSYLSFDPKTGAPLGPEKLPESKQYQCGAANVSGPMLDGYWTRINHRRAGRTHRLKGLCATQMAWDEQQALVANHFGKGGGASGALSLEKVFADAVPPKWDFTWTLKHNVRSHQVQALVLTADKALYAGRLLDPKPGAAPGFLWVVARADGKVLADLSLHSAPVCDGIAVAAERMYLALENGELLCYGEQ